jgi:N-acetylneuraminate 9-O-acetyltransferase
MARSKLKPFSTYEQVAVAIERLLQTTLAIIALGVIYRYCWIGLFSQLPVALHSRCIC